MNALNSIACMHNVYYAQHLGECIILLKLGYSLSTNTLCIGIVNGVLNRERLSDLFAIYPNKANSSSNYFQFCFVGGGDQRAKDEGQLGSGEKAAPAGRGVQWCARGHTAGAEE